MRPPSFDTPFQSKEYRLPPAYTFEQKGLIYSLILCFDPVPLNITSFFRQSIYRQTISVEGTLVDLNYRQRRVPVCTK